MGLLGSGRTERNTLSPLLPFPSTPGADSLIPVLVPTPDGFESSGLARRADRPRRDRKSRDAMRIPAEVGKIAQNQVARGTTCLPNALIRRAGPHWMLVKWGASLGLEADI